MTVQSDAVTTPAVLVCGGGLAGTMAAVAAARAGASTLLLERYGFLGGNATAGAVAQFNSWRTAGGRTVIAGMAQEVVDRLRRYGAAGEHHSFVMSNGHHMDRVEYSPELLKLVLDDMVREAGVQPLLHTQLLQVDVENHRICSVHVLTKGGVRVLRPQVLIDASGDLDAMQRAGARFLPLAPGEALQPATMMFRFGPIDFAQMEAIPIAEMAALAARGHAQGRLARAALHASRDPFGQDGWFNISRLAVDATDPLALSAAEMEGRRQAWQAAEFLRKHVPGCERGRLLAFGTQVGIRETRRVAGDHVLQADELRRAEDFPDTIALGAYPIDIHPATGGGLRYETLGPDHAYRIPLRSLIPVGLDNALVAGRGLSATHEALAAVRVMTITMAIGQAAGTAAALAARASAADPTAAARVREISVTALRQQLLREGACLT